MEAETGYSDSNMYAVAVAHTVLNGEAALLPLPYIPPKNGLTAQTGGLK